MNTTARIQDNGQVTIPTSVRRQVRQRRIIDARLAKADEDIKQGRVQGPFDTHEAMMTLLHSKSKKARTGN